MNGPAVGGESKAARWFKQASPITGPGDQARASLRGMTSKSAQRPPVPNPDNVPPKVTLADLLEAGATVDLITAAGALGIGRTKAYELARADQFPCRIIRIGETYRVPTPALLELICGVPVLPPALATQSESRS